MEQKSKNGSVLFYGVLFPFLILSLFSLTAYFMQQILSLGLILRPFFVSASVHLLRLILAVLLILWIKTKYRSYCSIGLGISGFLQSLILSIPLLFAAFWNVGEAWFYHVPLVSGRESWILAVLTGAGPAFFEEILMRGIVLSLLMLQCKDVQKGNRKAVWFSALVFGLTHLLNLFGQNPVQTICQVVYAFSFGVALGAVYVRSRNLWGCILVHFAMDFTSALFLFRGSEEKADVLFAVFGSVIFLVYAILLLRDSSEFGKREKTWEKGRKTHLGLFLLLLWVALIVGLYYYASNLFLEDEPDVLPPQNVQQSQLPFEILEGSQRFQIRVPRETASDTYHYDVTLSNQNLHFISKNEDGVFLFSATGSAGEDSMIRFVLKMVGSDVELKSYELHVSGSDSCFVEKIW